jgi:hypothetical protein
VNTAEAHTWHTVRDHLRAVLVEAQKERHLRPNLVQNTIGGFECEWAVYERSVMLGEVNRRRALAAVEPVSADLLERAEQQACGHVDYTDKFATNCAELALSLGHWTER